MKIIILYQCETCNFSSTDRLETKKHEASHYGLSLEEYNKWHKLRKNAATAGSRVNTTRNPETARQFDEAVDKLVKFETAHNLTKENHQPTCKNRTLQ